MTHKLRLLVLTVIVLFCVKPVISQEKNDWNFDMAKSKISEYLGTLEKQGFSGSVLVAHKGIVLLEKGYGYANRENQTKCTEATVFDIGSITKQFTGAAILKLEKQGKLSVQDKLSKYYHNVPGDKKDITLHQLLTHSAGFPPAIGDDYKEISTNEYVERAFKRKLLFNPGTQYKYSNVGYSLLGIIVEKASEMSYEEFLYKNLWKPAGMYQTGYQKPNFKDIAVGYEGKKEWGKPTDKNWASDGPFWHLKGNGGVLSTVQDMYKWHQALLGTKILDKEAKTKYYGKHVEEGAGAGSYYGYGWAIFPTPRKTELIAHNGGNGIFFADFWRYLEEDITIIMMTNAVKRKFERIPSQIAGILLKPDFEPEIPNVNTKSSINGKMADNLVRDFMKTINSTDKSTWESFLKRRTITSFLESFPMEEHLTFFREFHDSLKNGEIVEVRVNEGNKVNLGVKTPEGLQIILFDVVEASGGLKIDGIRM